MPSEFAQILINSSGAVVTSAMFLWFMLKIVTSFTTVISEFSVVLKNQSNKLEELTVVIQRLNEVTEEQNIVIGKLNTVTEDQNTVIKDQKDIIQKMYEEFLRKYKKARG